MPYLSPIWMRPREKRLVTELVSELSNIDVSRDHSLCLASMVSWREFSRASRVKQTFNSLFDEVFAISFEEDFPISFEEDFPISLLVAGFAVSLFATGF